MNYGHRLEFGAFITPRNDTPETVVGLAQRSEALGFDLVTFQDHPYQPRFLDTWTLMAWMAGQTERVQLAANVHNLPLRAPAVLARSAASLDLLSNGRLALGLGAGAYWEAITAMGGVAKAPGEAVGAFSEALDVLRAMFDVGEGASVRYAGRHYQLDGAQPGPTPAHDIPLWVGARQPRMLRLIGQKADGWLPTLNFLKPGDLRAGNHHIDEAAQAAGRDPREIRRLVNIAGTFAGNGSGFLNGPSTQWVDELLPLVVDDGVGTLILMTDDERSLEQFAQEVMPALRAAVEQALPGNATAPTLRRTAARDKRRAGIDYDGVPAALADAVVEPGDVRYARVKSNYLRGGAPGIVFEVKDTSQVVAALAFARAHPTLPLGIRSGGHGISGRSTNNGGIVIDLGRLNQIEVLDMAQRRVRIGPGARWMEVAAALEPYGWALSSGDYGGVGVGGLATAGGIGFLARQQGLTLDHIRAVEMVLADGSVVRASETEHPDLLWAVRGAGGNFGIVTAFEFEVEEVGDVGWAILTYDARDPARLLEKWGAAVEAAPRDLTSFILLGLPRQGQPAVAQAMTMIANGDPETVLSRLQPLAAAAPLYDANAVITSYANVMANAQQTDHAGQGEPVARSGLVAHITPEFADAATQLLYSGAVFFFQIRSVGSAVADVDPDATAYAYRSANFHVTAIGASPARVNAAWDKLRPYFDGLYLSFETDPRPERLHDAFPPRTLERLRALKARYDPDNVFRDNFNIQPAAQGHLQVEGRGTR